MARFGVSVALRSSMPLLRALKRGVLVDSCQLGFWGGRWFMSSDGVRTTKVKSSSRPKANGSGRSVGGRRCGGARCRRGVGGVKRWAVARLGWRCAVESGEWGRWTVGGGPGMFFLDSMPLSLSRVSVGTHCLSHGGLIAFVSCSHPATQSRSPWGTKAVSSHERGLAAGLPARPRRCVSDCAIRCAIVFVACAFSNLFC